LAEEISGSLRTAAVFAEHADSVGSNLQDGKAMAAYVNDCDRAVAEKKPAASQLSLFYGNILQMNLRRKTSGDSGVGCSLPINATQGIQQCGRRFLPMLDYFTSAYAPSTFTA
jgi:hypothetical protein